MITALLIGWLTMVSIQLIFIVFIFSKTALYRAQTPVQPSNATTSEGVTLVICAHNELPNLTDLLPLLACQQHARFEVLIMDDRSSDGTKEWLPGAVAAYTNVRFIRVDNDYEHVSPKKYALTIALKKALYPVVLLTDADCRPASDQWLAGMANALPAEKSIVLGVSLYQQRPGLLNFLIQSETLFTAVQYLSLALAGRPYMGVGRNLLYRTKTFFDNRGFYTHINVLGGDDDLFINEVGTGANTTISLDPMTFTESIPKETWAAWRHQKRRHLSVSHRYKSGHKLRLGLLTGSHVLTWLLGLVGGVYVLYTSLTDPVELANPFLLTVAGLFLTRWLLFWLVVGQISQRLNNTVAWYAIPFMDVFLAVYYALMGMTTLLRRQQKMNWR